MEQEKRGPGRPPKYHEAAQNDPYNQGLAGQSIGAQAQVAIDAPVRPARKPFGNLQQKLSYPERPGFHRHRFNDIPGRIQAAIDAGYTHVKDQEGKNVSWIVGTAPSGGPLVAFLMEIPEEWFQEDMARGQEPVNATEEAMRRGTLGEGDNRYVPQQGISIKHG